MQQFLQFW